MITVVLMKSRTFVPGPALHISGSGSDACLPCTAHTIICDTCLGTLQNCSTVVHDASTRTSGIDLEQCTSIGHGCDSGRPATLAGIPCLNSSQS